MADRNARTWPPARQALSDLWDEHTRYEFTTKDTEATLATMVDDAAVNHVPVMTGARGKDALRLFYGRHFIPQMPPDFETTTIERTVDDGRLVEEVVARFTHTVPMDWILPGVPPTGKRVVMALAVSVDFRDGKLCNERIYWDQASVLVQVGLLDPRGLPVHGARAAEKVLDPTLPSNELIPDWPRG